MKITIELLDQDIREALKNQANRIIRAVTGDFVERSHFRLETCEVIPSVVITFNSEVLVDED